MAEIKLVECEACGTMFDPEDLHETAHSHAMRDGLCWDCLIDTCVVCGDNPPGGIDPVTEMCDWCHEEMFPEDDGYGPED